MRVHRIDWNLDLRYSEKSFSGKVSIELEGGSDPLVVDSARLAIHSATLDGNPASFRDDPARGILEFPGVSPGPHRLEIAYDGAADPHSLVGLYVSPCGKHDALTTMLFPTGSRRLLPTFEDPTVKTVYRLTLTVESEVTAIFNTSPESERRVGGRKEITFHPTPRMSAYLLYLGVGPFDTLTVPGTPWSVTVATSPGRASSGRFCAERASRILAAYEEYYGIPYPLPKLDLVALENFWAGAMENWGAIAFREVAVLVDPTSTAREERIVLLVLAHEIAHQWFGDLVTPARWDDFWLNEAFATFVGHRIVDRLYPETDPWAYYMIRYGARGLEQDSRTATHPVKVPVHTPEELGEISDDVTYGKGAHVLRMVEDYLGEEAFRRGISHYLDQHQYANARAEDLWAALSEVSEKPVGRVMTEWITRPGYPLVRVRWSDGRLELRQERFRADGADAPEVWPIPLRIRADHAEHQLLFDQAESTLPVRHPEGLRVSPERAAFIRVLYDETLFPRILAEFPSMTPIDQWGLVVDTHAFVYAELAPLSQFLDVVRAGRSLTAELPIVALGTSLANLYRPLFDEPALLEASREFYRAQISAVGLEPRPGEPSRHRLLREVLSTELVRIDPGFARELSPRFAKFDELPADLLRAVATAYAVTEGERAFQPLVDRLKSATKEAERQHMAASLAAFRDPRCLRRSLELVGGTVITPTIASEMLFEFTQNPHAGSVLFEWYRERAEMVSRIFAGTPLMSLLCQEGIPVMGLDREVEVAQYFREHTPPEAVQGVAQGLESLRLVMRLRRTRGRPGPSTPVGPGGAQLRR